MPEHKVWHSRIFILRALPERMHISDHAGIPVLFIKEPILGFCLNRLAVPEMVISHDIIAFPAQKLCELVISPDIFHHSVADLKDGPHFAFGLPLDCMDLRIAVL